MMEIAIAEFLGVWQAVCALFALRRLKKDFQPGQGSKETGTKQ